MNIQQLHTQAMEIADRADMLKHRQQQNEANNLYMQALEVEREAALVAQQEKIGEPTQSILFRSAASLAYTIKDYREAERLICMGLAGNPPAEIADELRSLYDTVSIERSMEKMIAADSTGRERENVTITIPIKERNLLDVIVKKFGWACVF